MRRLAIMLGAVLSLAACGERHGRREARPAPADEEVVPPDETEDEAEEEAEEPSVFRDERSIMSTTFQITIIGADEATARTASREAFEEIARLEQVLSEWIPTSEISQINDAAGARTPVRVGDDTLAVVRESIEAGDWSEGAFDITWASLRGLYDFHPGSERHPTPRELVRPLTLIGYRHIQLDQEAHTVRLDRRGMSIGTGGIAKGYALDRAESILVRHGLGSFMMFAGGQVQVHGLRGDRPWRVGIKHPRRDDYFAFVEATSGTIATAGDYEHAFVDETGKRWHHIIDLSTGLPVEHTMQVTILAPTGTLGDAIDTGCFVMGAERCLARIAERSPECDAVIVDSSLRVHTTPGIRGRLRWSIEAPNGQLPE